jgi:hypothetical protein
MAKKEGLYRMAVLEKISGLPRKTIHFYTQVGLLHPPLKTGKTMAYSMTCIYKNINNTCVLRFSKTSLPPSFT